MTRQAALNAIDEVRADLQDLTLEQLHATIVLLGIAGAAPYAGASEQNGAVYAAAKLIKATIRNAQNMPDFFSFIDGDTNGSSTH